MRSIVIGGVILLALAFTAQAQVYKWVDENGRVHYSSYPPPNARSTQPVDIKPPPPSAQRAAEARQADQQQGSTSARSAKDAETEVTDEQIAEAYRKNCEIARNNLAILEDPSNRRFRVDGGEPVYYTDEQRAAKIAEVKASIERFCNGP